MQIRKLLIALMLCVTTGAFAHHGYDTHYDGTYLISLKGRVVSFSIENPHTRIVIEVAAAYREVRPIKRVTVWNTNVLRAEKFAARLRGDGFDTVAATRLDQAAAEADIITCATLSTQPLIEGRWLRPATLLDLIGGFTPTMRETDDEAVRRSAVYVDPMAAVVEAGDLVLPIAAGHFAASAVRDTLEMLCRNATNGCGSRDQITNYKSVGTVLVDLAAAALVYTGRNDARHRAGAST